MKKILGLILILMLAFTLTLSLAGCGEENPENEGNGDEEGLTDPTKILDYELSETGDYYIVTGYGFHNNSKVEIPSEYEGKPVREIADRAFSSATLSKENLKEIIIPASVTKIGTYAFSDCELLSSVTFKGSITKLSEGVFRSCTSLTSITLPEGLIEIDKYAFDMCSNLVDIKIPASVTKINTDAFRSCSKITGVAANDFNGVYTLPTENGCWVIKGDRTLTNANLPDNTVGIAGGAFKRCSGLTTVEIPASVRYICDEAFDGLTTLTKVEYGSNRAAWLNISIGENNYAILSAEVSYKE